MPRTHPLRQEDISRRAVTRWADPSPHPGALPRRAVWESRRAGSVPTPSAGCHASLQCATAGLEPEPTRDCRVAPVRTLVGFARSARGVRGRVASGMRSSRAVAIALESRAWSWASVFVQVGAAGYHTQTRGVESRLESKDGKCGSTARSSNLWASQFRTILQCQSMSCSPEPSTKRGRCRATRGIRCCRRSSRSTCLPAGLRTRSRLSIRLAAASKCADSDPIAWASPFTAARIAADEITVRRLALLMDRAPGASPLGRRADLGTTARQFVRFRGEAGRRRVSRASRLSQPTGILASAAAWHRSSRRRR